MQFLNSIKLMGLRLYSVICSRSACWQQSVVKKGAVKSLLLRASAHAGVAIRSNLPGTILFFLKSWRSNMELRLINSSF